MKRSLVLTLLLVVVLTGLGASAGPYPVIGEPVLRPDSAFEATPWGYKKKTLTFPAGPHNGTWPTVFTMEGYDGATRGDGPNAYLRMDDRELMALRIVFGEGPRDDYAFVQASTRGTECSGGHFNLYDARHAWDAHHIIEWIGTQSWSNGNVGMFGSSFPGQTAYWTAVTQPPHLKAVSANLLHSDIYRDIFMPGGVQNILFPSLWTYGLGVVAGPHRVPVGSAEDGVLARDEICAQAQIARYSVGDLPQPQNEAIFAGLRSVDDDWYRDHAARTYVDSIKIPYYQQGNWQDEQVGPRAVVLFNHINPTPRTILDKFGNPKTVVPKRFVMSNGDHGWGNYAGNERWAWFDIWLLGMKDELGLLNDQIVNHFEAQNGGASAGKKSGNAWPFENTTYERWFLRGGSGLSPASPSSGEGSDTYLSGVARQGWFFYAYDPPEDELGPAADAARAVTEPVATASGPDVAAYLSAPLGEQKVVAGPILAEINASIAGTDADFFVSISDVYPDGRVSYLQRGLLKASHRAVDPLRSYYDGSTLVLPYRPHTNPQPVFPGVRTFVFLTVPGAPPSATSAFATAWPPAGSMTTPMRRPVAAVDDSAFRGGFWPRAPPTRAAASTRASGKPRIRVLLHPGCPFVFQ
jgi:putative CocE/NonD family hydrolase